LTSNPGNKGSKKKDKPAKEKSSKGTKPSKDKLTTSGKPVPSTKPVKIDIQGKDIETLPNAERDKENVTEVWLNGNKLDELPETSNWKGLLALFVQSNNLKAFPE